MKYNAGIITLIESKENEGTSKEGRNNLADSYSIEVKNLKKHFKGKRGMEDIKAVDGVSFHVESGEVFGLLGTNGAGKTTTINVLTGALLPTDGTATVGGYNVKTELKKIKERISVAHRNQLCINFFLV
jgi:ABC-type multidrug transport system ATPase subunit